jgi:hypothetical protein
MKILIRAARMVLKSSILAPLLVLGTSCAALNAASVTLAWDANVETDLGGYRVHYGTASQSYTSHVDVGNLTSITLSTLNSGTYYFAVTAYNSGGDESDYSNEVSATIAASDTTPPVISGLSVTSVTSSSATVGWNTNESSDSQVEYGISPSFGNATAIDSALVTTHAQQLTGLLAGTAYYCRVKSRDGAGNLSVSNSTSFTTALNCSYSVSPVGSTTFGAAVSTGVLSVTTATGCGWSAASDSPWLTISSPTSVTGSGTVSYAVAANASGARRVGTLAVAGRTVSITQEAASGCDMNRDGTANVLDLQLLVNVILGTTSCPGNCDINGDRSVNVIDLQTLNNVVLGVRSCP